MAALAAALAGCASPEEVQDPEVIDPDQSFVADFQYDLREGPHNETFTIPEDGEYDLDIRFQGVGGEECTESSDAAILLFDPQGVAYAEFRPVADPVVEGEEGCGTMQRENTRMVAGEWRAEIQGNEPYEVTVRIQPS